MSNNIFREYYAVIVNNPGTVSATAYEQYNTIGVSPTILAEASSKGVEARVTINFSPTLFVETTKDLVNVFTTPITHPTLNTGPFIPIYSGLTLTGYIAIQLTTNSFRIAMRDTSLVAGINFGFELPINFKVFNYVKKITP